MFNDPDCKKMNIGQTLDSTLEWVNTAVFAEMITKEIRFNPQETKRIVETWWPKLQITDQMI